MPSKYTKGLVLSILFPGLGQMYLGYVNREILILVLGAALIVTTVYFFGSFAIIIGGIYWVWNAHDAQQHGKQRFLSENPNLSRECGECHGTGKVRTATTAASMYSPFFASKCPTCNGIGYIPEDSVSL